MKHLFKILTIASLVLFTQSLKADVVSAAYASGTNNLKAAAIQLKGLTLANGTGSAITVALFDAPSTGFTYVAAAYTSAGYYQTNVVTTYTNIQGATFTNTLSYTVPYTTSVAQTTNNYSTITRITVPANTTTVWAPSTQLNVNDGLLVTNNGTITVTADYLPRQ